MYYKCKNITLDEACNQITINIAANNLRPLCFEKTTLKGETFEDKLQTLFDLIYSRELQIYKSVRNGTFERAWNYAWNEMQKEHPQIRYLSDLWDMDASHSLRNSVKVKEIKNKLYEDWYFMIAPLIKHGPRKKQRISAVLSMLEINSCHITEETAQMLSDEPDTDRLCLSVYPNDYGWFICLGHYLKHPILVDMPKDLKEVIAFAKEQGCSWIHIDADASICEALPKYVWS